MRDARAAGLFERYSPEKRERFREFHHLNPHVYASFEARARQMKQTGRKRYSARTIMEVMRWDRDIVTTGDTFKISNDLIPMYVRLLVYKHPEFEDFFALQGGTDVSGEMFDGED